MIKPLQNYILLEPVESEAKTASGIILSQAKNDKQLIAKVIAVGEGKGDGAKKIANSVKAGDKVIYKSYGGNEIEYENKKYIIIENDDILAIIE